MNLMIEMKIQIIIYIIFENITLNKFCVNRKDIESPDSSF